MDSIVEFYAGRSIFITGATGFIGKILIEKILRSLPKIEKIYMLIRAKKGQTPEQRVEALVNCSLFEKLKEQNPSAIKEKLVAISGDAKEIGLGLSDDDRQLLINNVSIIFHGAACVRFDDSLTDAILLNTRGTREVVKLALEMKKLDAFLYTSTTYCNIDREVVDEKLYPPHADWKKCIEIAENVDKHTLDILTPKFIAPLPNTYTFTKSLSEHCIYDMCRNVIPAIIFRPSIVIATRHDPVIGWIDNFNGPVGILLASGKGVLRCCYADPNVRADFMPADSAVRALLLAVWQKHSTTNVEEKLDVSFYNCSNNGMYEITMQEMIDMAKKIAWDYPLNSMLWYPDGNITNCKYWYYIKVLLVHLLPAVIVDTLLKILNKKPILVKVQRRIYMANMALKHFITNRWTFINDKCLMLENKLKSKEREDFGYDKDNVDIYKYFENCIRYSKRYLLKHEDCDEEKARKSAYRMYLLNIFVKIQFYTFLFWLLVYKYKIFNYIISKYSSILDSTYDV